MLVASAVLPSASLAWAVTVCEPAVRSVVVGIDHVPSAPAVTVPTSVPSTRTSTVSPASAVPRSVGRGLPMVLPSAGTVMATTVRVSTTNELVSVAVLPAVSAATARTSCVPSASGAGVGVDQVPSAAAVTVPTSVPSRKTWTVAPGSAVPLSVGRVSRVLEPSAGPVTSTSGAVVSMVNPCWSTAVLPAASVVSARTVCMPTARSAGGTSDQWPFASAAAVPTMTPSIRTMTSAPGSVSPLIVGRTSLVCVPSPGPRISRAGAIVSTTNEPVSVAVWPAASVARTETMCIASSRGVVTWKVQLPSASAVVVPRTMPSTVTCTVSPGSAVPLSSGVASPIGPWSPGWR